ncbi:MAG: AAA family ATPase [Myxococcota bacterium]|nr:AAA family ATPase [Myxococcota bacterium]
MIHRIEIVGLGPHRRFATELSPDGTTVISGPSEIGKSTVLEALVFALLGRGTSGRFRTELINDRAERVGVRLTLKSGLIVERGMTRKKKMTRAIISADKRRSMSSESALSRELEFIGEDPEIARMVMVPMSWQPMVATNARPFRDALIRILPPGDTPALVEELMVQQQHTVSNVEAGWSEKEALAARRIARKKQDEAAGRLEALTAQRDRLQQPTPAADSGGALPHAEAVAAEQTASAALQAATETFRIARRHSDDLTRRLAAFDADSPDRCPTCNRPGWQDGADAFAVMKHEHEQATASLEQVTTAGGAARQAHNLALQVLADSQRAAGAAAQREADLRDLQQALDAGTADIAQWEAECGRLDALLGVIREVPSLLAARQAQALGDLGPISLTFSDNPAVSVLIDGRPWWLASRGRQVVADMHLRAAIRRAAGLTGLPIVVDNVQDVGGQPLAQIPGPVVILRTTDETGISIQQLKEPAPADSTSAGQHD